MRVNRRKERWYLRLVERGVLRVTKSGRVRNNVTGRWIGEPGKSEYCQISVRRNGANVMFYVHRLVWLVFRGAIPDGMEINHKDGDKHNNRLSNLELVTAEANVQHAYRTGLNPPSGPRGSANRGAKLSEANIPVIFRLNAKGWSTKRIGTRFGVGGFTIKNVLTGKNWAHVAADRSRVRLKPPQKRLTPEEVRQIHRWHKRGETNRVIARRYGVSATTISDIFNGKRKYSQT